MDFVCMVWLGSRYRSECFQKVWGTRGFSSWNPKGTALGQVLFEEILMLQPGFSCWAHHFKSVWWFGWLQVDVVLDVFNIHTKRLQHLTKNNQTWIKTRCAYICIYDRAVHVHEKVAWSLWEVYRSLSSCSFSALAPGISLSTTTQQVRPMTKSVHFRLQVETTQSQLQVMAGQSPL